MCVLVLLSRRRIVFKSETRVFYGVIATYFRKRSRISSKSTVKQKTTGVTEEVTNKSR